MQFNQGKLSSEGSLSRTKVGVFFKSLHFLRSGGTSRRYGLMKIGEVSGRGRKFRFNYIYGRFRGGGWRNSRENLFLAANTSRPNVPFNFDIWERQYRSPATLLVRHREKSSIFRRNLSCVPLSRTVQILLVISGKLISLFKLSLPSRKKLFLAHHRFITGRLLRGSIKCTQYDE